MLEKIRLEGYRLLDNFEADLGQLTVVIGANATGKSSFLDAISLITLSTEWPIEDVLFNRGGIDSILNRGSSAREIAWEITLSKPADGPFRVGSPVMS